jgi:hypothetical protein
MKRKSKSIDVKSIVAGVTGGVIIAGGFYLMLGALSHPQDFKARAHTLDGEISRTERLTKDRGDAQAFPAGAVCDNSHAGADDLTRRVQGAAAAASVVLANFTVTPPADGATHGAAAPVAVQFSATGKYEAVLGMLSAMDRAQPQIFVDTADLKPSSGGAVSLKFSGSVLCWTSAHH